MFRLGRRATFNGIKVAKTIDVLPATSDRADANLWRAAQLAEPVLSFVEGPDKVCRLDQNLHPEGQAAGIV